MPLRSISKVLKNKTGKKHTIPNTSFPIRFNVSFEYLTSFFFLFFLYFLVDTSFYISEEIIYYLFYFHNLSTRRTSIFYVFLDIYIFWDKPPTFLSLTETSINNLKRCISTFMFWGKAYYLTLWNIWKGRFPTWKNKKI